MATMTQPATANQGVVLFDGDCAFCQKTVRILKKLDWLGKLQFQNCREPENIPPNSANLHAERMLEEMHLLTPDRANAYAGFKAVRWIFARLPLTWIAWPFMFIPGVPQIGQKIYLFIARHRYKIVPCHNGICTIPPKRS